MICAINRTVHFSRYYSSRCVAKLEIKNNSETNDGAKNDGYVAHIICCIMNLISLFLHFYRQISILFMQCVAFRSMALIVCYMKIKIRIEHALLSLALLFEQFECVCCMYMYIFLSNVFQNDIIMCHWHVSVKISL